LPVSCENKSTTIHSTQFMIRTEEGSVLYLCTKFQTDSSIRSKLQYFVQKLQNLEIGSPDPGHAHLGVVLLSTQEGTVLHLYTKFEADRSILSKAIRGPKMFQVIFEIGSRDPDHAHLGSFYRPHATRVRPVCLYQI